MEKSMRKEIRKAEKDKHRGELSDRHDHGRHYRRSRSRSPDGMRDCGRDRERRSARPSSERDAPRHGESKSPRGEPLGRAPRCAHMDVTRHSVQTDAHVHPQRIQCPRRGDI